MKSIVTVILLLISGLALPQGNCDENIPKKGKKKFDKAISSYHIRNTEAIDEVKEISEKYPEYVEPYYFLATHYEKTAFKSGRENIQAMLIEKAIGYYKRVEEICPSFAGHLSLYKLGVLYHKELAEDSIAAHYFQNYLNNEKEPPKEYQQIASDLAERYFIVKRLMENPVAFEPFAIKGVNSEKDEYLPSLTPDNNYMYFTRRMKWSAKKVGAVNVQEEREIFTLSKKMAVDSFTQGRVLRGPFNNFEEPIDENMLIGLGGICLTPDNKRMYVTATLRELKKVNGKVEGGRNTQLYYSQLEQGSWTKLKPVTEVNDENNLPTWEGQPTISSDGRLIIFATARPTSTPFVIGGQEYNSMDLYMIKVDETGKWSGPINLGPVINTRGNEKTPFLHTDSRTLYFSSDGHPGMGGYDIFYTKMDENGIWSKPVNIGYPINTEKDEHGLIVSLDGKYAYMSGGKEGEGAGLDLIQFPLYPGARPEKVIFMKGKLEDENGDAVKNGKIQIRDEATGEVHEALVDEETGEYVAVMTVKDPKRKELPKEKIELEVDGEIVEADYGSKVEEVNGEETIIPPGGDVIELDGKDVVLKKGDKIKMIGGKKVLVPKDHVVVDEGGEQIVVPKKDADDKKQRFVISATGDDMALNTKVVEADPEEIDGAEKVQAEPTKIKTAKKGQTVRLNDVNFATNSSVLNSKSMLVIDELKRYLAAKPNMKIAIHGHTDNVGDPKENLQLSKDRAKEVMDYLIFEGIDPSRLTFQGFGETQPKASNSSESGRATNRRVEFVILEI